MTNLEENISNELWEVYKTKLANSQLLRKKKIPNLHKAILVIALSMVLKKVLISETNKLRTKLVQQRTRKSSWSLRFWSKTKMNLRLNRRWSASTKATRAYLPSNGGVSSPERKTLINPNLKWIATKSFRLSKRPILLLTSLLTKLTAELYRLSNTLRIIRLTPSKCQSLSLMTIGSKPRADTSI